MGMCIVRATQDFGDDRYFVWSTVVDNFTFVGTHREVFEYLTDKWGSIQVSASQVKQMLDRADEFGSSSELRRWRWEQESHVVANLHGCDDAFRMLPRANLGEVWDRMHAWATATDAGPEPTITDLTTEIDDEDL